MKGATTTTTTLMGYMWGIRYYEYTTKRPNALIGGWSTPWYSARQTAKCKPNMWNRHHDRNSPAPHNTNACGINFYDLDRAFENNHQYGPHYSITTICKGWGKIVTHELGFRAQKAQIHMAYVPEGYAYSTFVKISTLPGFTSRGVIFTRDFDAFLEEAYEIATNPANQLNPIPMKEGA